MRLFAIILMAIAAMIAVITAFRTPRTDRDWQPYLAPTPRFVALENGVWSLSSLRAFEFENEGSIENDWRATTVNPDDLVEVWFFVEPFESWSAVAHTFLSFVFEGEDPQTLSVSVEARREADEEYSPLRGMFNAYELLYQWSTEKDILTRIAVNLDHDLYAYRLKVTPEQGRAILNHFIQRTNQLAERPRFYNTVTSNCTNELAKAVNDAFPGALPWRRAYVFTGRSDEYLHRLGFLGEDDFKQLKSHANVKAIVNDLNKTPNSQFSDAWRKTLADQLTSSHDETN